MRALYGFAALNRKLCRSKGEETKKDTHKENKQQKQIQNIEKMCEKLAYFGKTYGRWCVCVGVRTYACKSAYRSVCVGAVTRKS